MLRQNLGPILQSIHSSFHRGALLDSDPIGLVHPYFDSAFCEGGSFYLEKRDDSYLAFELAALLASFLAYGNVRQIRASVFDAYQRLGATPAEWVASVRSPQKLAKRLLGWKHRFQTAEDLAAFVGLVRRSWEEYGSLGSHYWSASLRSRQKKEGLGGPLDHWMTDWREMLQGTSSQGLQHLIARPSDGSACKRACLFLRWMIRKDSSDQGVDFGVWQRLGASPAELVIPLDVHLARIGRHYGLLKRKSSDWRAALELTESLRAFDRDDPLKFDFALCRLGILKLDLPEQEAR